MNATVQRGLAGEEGADGYLQEMVCVLFVCCCIGQSKSSVACCLHLTLSVSCHVSADLSGKTSRVFQNSRIVNSVNTLTDELCSVACNGTMDTG